MHKFPNKLYFYELGMDLKYSLSPIQVCKAEHFSIRAIHRMVEEEKNEDFQKDNT